TGSLLRGRAAWPVSPVRGNVRRHAPSGAMKVSFFETVRYRAPQALPSEWPVPSGAYDRDAGAEAYRGMIERLEYVEELGFDWVSVSEHHYSPRILTPSLPIAAAYIASQVRNIKIALLGPIVPQSNPVLLAEEMEMILRAWKEPEPFGWQGRHFHYRTVSVWPKPLQQPLPPIYALGTSSEA